MSSLPLSSARNSGVFFPARVARSGFALLSSSFFTTDACPAQVAAWSGVRTASPGHAAWFFPKT